jgi:tryptophanyl-tRNA synthetase
MTGSDNPTGSRSLRAHVDSQHHGFYGLPIPHDTMEGQWKDFALSTAPSLTFRQSKLSLPEDTSPLDGGSKSKLKLGLFSYPVLQAADILVHRYVLTPNSCS